MIVLNMGKIVAQAVRCQDPFRELRKGWVVRRLAPDYSRAELTMLPKGRDEYKLLEAIGRETANVHLGSKRVVAKGKRNLSNRPQDGYTPPPRRSSRQRPRTGISGVVKSLLSDDQAKAPADHR